MHSVEFGRSSKILRKSVTREPALERVRTLKFTRFEMEGQFEFFLSPYLSNIHTLHFSRCRFSRFTGIGELLQFWSRLGSLRTLIFDQSDFDARCFAQLAMSRMLRQLDRVEISVDEVSVESVLKLAESPNLKGPEVLAIKSPSLTEDDLAAIQERLGYLLQTGQDNAGANKQAAESNRKSSSRPKKKTTKKQSGFKLITKERAVLDQYLEQTPTANLTVWQWLEMKGERADREFNDADSRNTRCFSSLPDDQYYLICLTGTYSNDGHGVEDAIARRMHLNSPLELALRMSVLVRFTWLQAQWSGHACWEGLYGSIILATAARDFQAAREIVRLSIPKGPDGDLKSEESLTCGVVALMNSDREELSEAVRTFKRRHLGVYNVKMVALFKAVLEGSPTEVAEKLNDLVNSYRQSVRSFTLMRHVDVNAFGLYELIKQFSPELVSEFDTTRKGPWDAEYFQWSQQVDDISKHYEINSIPEVLSPHLLDFEPLEWGAWVRENWDQT